MKLYTEEQLNKAFDYGYLFGGLFKKSLIKKLTPIELPSDEEILTKSQEEPDNSDIETAARIGYVAGAKWMRDKIGGNK